MRGLAEERHVHAVAAARVLVGRVPQQAAALEVPRCATHILLGEHRVGVSRAAAQHRPFHRRVGVGPVHAGERHAGLAQQPAARFERGEVPGHHDHAAPACARGLEVFEAFDAQAAFQRLDRSPPGAAEFEQAGAERGEVFAQQSGAHAFVQSGETQREVARGDAPAFAQGGAQQRAEHRTTESTLQRPGQARGEREQADAAPRRPGARR